MSNQYMYRYLVSKLIGSKVLTQAIRGKTVCLLLILGPGGEIDRLLVLSDYYSALQKTITRWSDIVVMEGFTKTRTICAFTICVSLQIIIWDFMT